MTIGKAFFMAIVCLLLQVACRPAQTQTDSPNGKITASFCKDNSFIVSYHEKGNTHIVFTLADIGLKTRQGGGKMELVSVSDTKRINDSYRMLHGKRKNCYNEGTERVYSFADSMGIAIDVIFRVYNDGIAFRYSFPNEKEAIITEERTTYRVADNIKRWTQELTSSYEDFYPMNTDGGTGKSGKWGYPALFQVSDSVWTLITEANIDNANCGSWLTNIENKSSYKVELSENNLKCTSGWASPWRVAMIGTLSDIVESTLVTDVSKPCEIEDVSWVAPGLVSWIYWAYNHGSKDYQIVKKYIDFAAELKLPYVLIDWEWDVMGNGGDLHDAIAYAHEKGVKPMLWYNSSTAWASEGAAGPLFRLNTPESRKKEFQWLKEMGVKGIKVDFFNQDSLSTMQYFIDLMEDAAKYQLMINFHGATIPRGWQRTYPNLMTVEGVYGAEWYNNAPVLTDRAAWHNTTLPFTRNVIGSMDYTPCTFTDSQHPHLTSNAHELALLVVFESALQHLADRPEGYLSQPLAVRDLISGLPAAWDETKLLCGYPSEYIVIARRKGDTWYIAGLNGTNEKKTLTFSPDFIEENTELQLFADGANTKEFAVKTITKKDNVFSVDCLPRGGFIIRQ